MKKLVKLIIKILITPLGGAIFLAIAFLVFALLAQIGRPLTGFLIMTFIMGFIIIIHVGRRADIKQKNE